MKTGVRLTSLGALAILVSRSDEPTRSEGYFGRVWQQKPTQASSMAGICNDV